MSPRINPPVSFVTLLDSAVKKGGVGMLVAAVFGVATMRIYSDLERRNDALVELVREQTRVSQEVGESMRSLSRQLESFIAFSN